MQKCCIVCVTVSQSFYSNSTSTVQTDTNTIMSFVHSTIILLHSSCNKDTTNVTFLPPSCASVSSHCPTTRVCNQSLTELILSDVFIVPKGWKLSLCPILSCELSCHCTAAAGWHFETRSEIVLSTTAVDGLSHLAGVGVNVCMCC